MKTRISLSRVLDRLLKVEQLAADLYGHYATTFAHVEDARELFIKMKNEEINHKNQVFLQKRIVSQSPTTFDVLEVDLEGIDKMVRDVKIEINRQNVTLLEALDFAILLETDAFEAVYRTAIAKHSPELSNLVRLLSGGDAQHVEQLKNCRNLMSNRKKY